MQTKSSVTSTFAELPTTTELELAIADLQLVLDLRLDAQGGYPAEISTAIEGWIVVADVDHDEAPVLMLLRVEKYLAVWRAAKADLEQDIEKVARDPNSPVTYEDIAHSLLEHGVYESCEEA